MDDILRAGTGEVSLSSLLCTLKRFKTKELEKTPFEFTDLLVSGGRRLRRTSHEQYIERLESLTLSTKYEKIRSMRQIFLRFVIHFRIYVLLF